MKVKFVLFFVNMWFVFKLVLRCNSGNIFIIIKSFVIDDDIIFNDFFNNICEYIDVIVMMCIIIGC